MTSPTKDANEGTRPRKEETNGRAAQLLRRADDVAPKERTQQMTTYCDLFLLLYPEATAPGPLVLSSRGSGKEASGQVPHASSRYRASKASLSAFKFKQLFRSGYSSPHKDLDRKTYTS